MSYANEEDCQIYYSPDSLYLFYKAGHDDNYAFYCKKYVYPLDDTNGYAFAGSEPYINFKNRSMYLKMMNQIGRLPNIKKPVAASNKFIIDDTVNLNFPTKTSKLIQLANIDSFNIVYLVQDTITFEGYLIWSSKLFGRTLSYKVTDRENPPERISMFIAYPNKGIQTDIIINTCSLGNCDSDFYILYNGD